MTPAFLAAAGAALYGPRWQSELARSLGVSDRTMRRWLSGENPIPAGVWGDCCALLRVRRLEIGNLLDPPER
jgi:hypothetical protein